MKQQTFFSGNNNRLTVPPNKSQRPQPPQREPLNSYLGLVTAVTLFVLLFGLQAYFGEDIPPPGEPHASGATATEVCDRSCENDTCAHPWGDDAQCVETCRAHLADCSETELGAIACEGDCDAINQCLLNAPCD